MSAATHNAQVELERTKPEDTDFRQQRLRAWQPVLTPFWVVFTFLIVTAAFIPIGVVLLRASDSVVSVEARYDDICGAAATCSVSVTVPEDMEAPVYLYYKLTNFFQNHRRYVMSRSDTQLAGLSGSVSSCSPLEKWDEKTLYPCGLVASSHFTDTIDGTYALPLPDGSHAPAVPFGTTLRRHDIAWSSDIGTKFKDLYPPGTPLPPTLTRVGPTGELPRISDERLMVWMRTAPLSTFKKLAGVVERDLPKGTVVTFEIDNQYSVEGFGGTKTAVLSTVSWAGSKSDFLGWAYIATGAACGAFALLFGLKAWLAPRPLGDMKYFSLRSARG